MLHPPAEVYTRVVVGLCLVAVLTQSCNNSEVVPTLREYNDIAMRTIPNSAAKATPVMHRFKHLQPVCVGEAPRDECQQQASKILQSRGLVPSDENDDYGLSIFTAYHSNNPSEPVEVTLTLTDNNGQPVYRRSESIFATDRIKAGRNLNAAMEYGFATEWAIANHKPPKFVELKSLLDLSGQSQEQENSK